MGKLFRYSLGVGVGCFFLALFNGFPLEQAGLLAGSLVAIGWALWGGIALSPEYKKVAVVFAEVTAVGVEMLVKKLPAPGLSPNGRHHSHSNGSVKPPPTRQILVNTAHSSHYMTLEEHTEYRRLVILFLALGGRIQSFKKRDMEIRLLSNGDKVDFDMWKFSDLHFG